jgi:hypothetical protein
MARKIVLFLALFFIALPNRANDSTNSRTGLPHTLDAVSSRHLEVRRVARETESEPTLSLRHACRLQLRR